MDLKKNYTATDCARLWKMYPRTVALKFDLSNLPRRPFSKFVDPEERKSWRGFEAPAVYPMCLVQKDIKTVEITNGDMHSSELETTLGKCAELKALSVHDSIVYLDRGHLEADGEMDSYSLEWHAATLEKISFRFVNFVLRGDKKRFFDLRWLYAVDLSTLKELELKSLYLPPFPFSQLIALTNLHTLALCDLAIGDCDIEDLIPSLPKLRSLSLHQCHFLSEQSLQFIAARLNLLDVSRTEILRLPSSSISAHNSGAPERMSAVKSLAVHSVTQPRFEVFLHYFSAISIERLSLRYIRWGSPADLAYILSKATGLLELELSSIFWLDDSVYMAISKLARLRKLNLRKTNASHDILPWLASGACRHSLRRIDFTRCSNFEDMADARVLALDRFDSCEIAW